MADLDVQPKRKSAWWLWALLALLLLLLLFFFSRSCNKDKAAPAAAAATDSSNTVTGVTTPTGATADSAGGWNDVDMNAPSAKYDEITDTNIGVRGNDNYGIYDIGENILFDEGKSTIRPDAEKNLKQLSASIQKRFAGGDVRIYGYTDAIGSAGYNKQLAEQRAQAVSNWLSANGGLSADHLSLNAVGEAKPVATNATEAGRQQNRRVEIVARKAKK